MPMDACKGRFAPSPTGRMHLGNIFTALISWLDAKSRGGTWLLRIEDLDTQRSRYEYARLIEDDLSWLGLEWDEGGLDDTGDAAPYSQSRRSGIYAGCPSRLEATGFTYPCRCTRAGIMAARAPHQRDGRVIYGGTCRPGILPCHAPRPDYPHAVRLYVPDTDIVFTDCLRGRQHFNLARECGDFILRRADGAWAYQLAVVVDDALMGVTRVVRGCDLLLSAAQQIYLYGLLGFRAPEFAHVPLLCNGAGQRLSKRDGALDMESLRRTHTPGQLVGRLAFMAGLTVSPEPCSPSDLVPLFSPECAGVLAADSIQVG